MEFPSEDDRIWSEDFVEVSGERMRMLVRLFPPPWGLSIHQDRSQCMIVDKDADPVPLGLPIKMAPIALLIITAVNTSPLIHRLAHPSDGPGSPLPVLPGLDRHETKMLILEIFLDTGFLPIERAWFHEVLKRGVPLAKDAATLDRFLDSALDGTATPSDSGSRPTSGGSEAPPLHEPTFTDANWGELFRDLHLSD